MPIKERKIFDIDAVACDVPLPFTDDNKYNNKNVKDTNVEKRK